MGFEQERRALERCGPIRHHQQRFDVDLDQFQTRPRPAPDFSGYHQGERLADVGTLEDAITGW